MNPNALTGLARTEVKLVKQISLVSQSIQNNDIVIGYILYERGFTPTYKINEIPKEQRDFDYYLNYPSQAMYPNDAVDAMILQSVKNSLPNSFAKSHAIVFNANQDFIKNLQSRPALPGAITIIPSLNDININDIEGKAFASEHFNITVYANASKKHMQNLNFLGYYDISEESLLKQFKAVKFI